jgi:ketosteroid isomerase-like protein
VKYPLLTSLLLVSLAACKPKAGPEEKAELAAAEESTMTPELAEIAAVQATIHSKTTESEANKILLATNPEKNAIFAAIEENTKAMEREDIDAVMATVHPETPNFEATKAFLEDYFSKTDLKYEVSSLTLISLKDGEAQVSFLQKSIPTTSGPAASVVVAEGVHTLKKDGEKWKLLRSVAVPVSPQKGK